MYLKPVIAPDPLVYVPPLTSFSGSQVGTHLGIGPNRSFMFLDKMCRHPFWVLLGMLVAVFGAYLPALDADFLWDDEPLVVKNFLIRSPLSCIEVFRHTLFGGASNFFRPTQTLTFIADYWVWGLQPFGYHLTSILIHALNGFLLFLLLRRILPVLCPSLRTGELGAGCSRADVPAFAIAALWAVHPVHSAAVAYVSGSADSLAMLCCLSAWLLTGNARTAVNGWRGVACGCGAGAALLLGLCSKEIAFVWLALFACYSLFFDRADRGWRFQWKTLAGSLAVFAVYLVLRHNVGAPNSHNSLPPHSAMIMALRALGDYGSLIVFPGRLLMERQVYPAPGAVLTADDRLFYSSLTCGGVLLVVVLAAGFCWRGPGRTMRRFGVCWFLFGFLPISNLFVTINAVVAEHWLYLPSIGLLLFAAGGLLELRTSRLRVHALAAVLVVTALFGVRTYWRSFDWVDEMAFFRQTVEAGGDLPRARMGMANAYAHSHHDAAAVDLLQKLIKDCPYHLATRINLGTALVRLGRLEEARPILEAALPLCAGQEPRQVLVVLGSLDKLEEGSEWSARRQKVLGQLRANNPDSWEIADFDAREAEKAGDPAAAIDGAARYARGHWWHYPSHVTLGRLLEEAGRHDEAERVLIDASRLDVHDAEALSMAAEVDTGQGHLVRAEALLKRAVARRPDSPRQHLLMCSILTATQHPEEAAVQADIATALLRQTAGALTP